MDTGKNINVSKGVKVNTNPKEIEEFLTRGVEKIIKKEELKKKMLSGKQLRAYIGYDVTGPDLHIGHGSTLMKLKHWQELGHKVILLIGDDTSRIGDHSDKLEKRKRLTDKEIDNNKSQFREQFGKIIELDKAEVHYNSEWLDQLKFRDVVELASFFSVQQMITRENFAKRLKSNKTIGLEELLYPLMQGYDSVALEVDLEMGATDQTFNMVAGRKIMHAFKIEPQCVLIVPFITGTDGRKMGKSLGNFIPMRATTNDLYGGIMSCIDDVIIEYFYRLTRIPIKEIEQLEKDLKFKKIGPMELKKKLAFEVVKIYYDEKQALEAEKHFEKTVQKGEVPDEVAAIDRKVFKGSQISLLEMLKTILKERKGDTGLPASIADAKRLAKQGGVKVNGKKATDLNKEINIQECPIITIGKRYHLKIRN